MTQVDSIYRDKGDGTQVNYYLFPEYEIHLNVLAAGAVQGWHHHSVISETIVVTSGEIEVRWLDEVDNLSCRTLHPGDVVEVGTSRHTVANPSSAPATFHVFRFVPDGVNKRELIKNDRHADDPPT